MYEELQDECDGLRRQLQLHRLRTATLRTPGDDQNQKEQLVDDHQMLLGDHEAIAVAHQELCEALADSHAVVRDIVQVFQCFSVAQSNKCSDLFAARDVSVRVCCARRREIDMSFSRIHVLLACRTKWQP